MIQGDPLSACPNRQFPTLSIPGLLDSWAALSNPCPNTCMPSRAAVCTIFMMVFGMTRRGRKPTALMVDMLTTQPSYMISDVDSDISPYTPPPSEEKNTVQPYCFIIIIVQCLPLTF